MLRAAWRPGRPRRSNLWTPTSQRGVDFSNTSEAPVIYAGQGPPPPSPLVVERFQQVISQLFQQVRGRGARRCPVCSAPGMEGRVAGHLVCWRADGNVGRGRYGRWFVPCGATPS